MTICWSRLYNMKTFMLSLPRSFFLHRGLWPSLSLFIGPTQSADCSAWARFFPFCAKGIFQNSTYINTNVGSLYKSHFPVNWIFRHGIDTIFCTSPVLCIQRWSVLSIDSGEVRWPILCLGLIFMGTLFQQASHNACRLFYVGFKVRDMLPVQSIVRGGRKHTDDNPLFQWGMKVV